jgi:hypothetical protein
MRLLATLLLVAAFASPSVAAVIHDESVDGDLSSSPAAPTPLVFALGGNTILGTTSNTSENPLERDYITFTLPLGWKLVGLNLLAFSPDNIAFTAFNEGATSYIPSPITDTNFLAGIHISGPDLGTDLMPKFVCCAVTTNSLGVPELETGTYSFIIQQASAVVTTYSLEFVVSEDGVQVESSTWGRIKGLFR